MADRSVSIVAVIRGRRIRAFPVPLEDKSDGFASSLVDRLNADSDLQVAFVDAAFFGDVALNASPPGECLYVDILCKGSGLNRAQNVLKTAKKRNGSYRFDRLPPADSRHYRPRLAHYAVA